MIACGLDFGTSNSAIGVPKGDAAALVPLEGDTALIPSAVFFEAEDRYNLRFGADAVVAYVQQVDGRLFRALKTILGSALIEEATTLGKYKIPLADVVQIFVRHLKVKAEAFLEREITAVVHGRPVRFVDDDDAADWRAERMLEEIARKVGFREIAFVYEPIAAAYHYEQGVRGEELVLVADIGGGTSDFSVIRIGPGRRDRAGRKEDILACAGVRVGGTDFDAEISLEAIMPLLGRGSPLLEKGMTMPNALYRELATWATINFTYTYRNEREVAQLLREAREPEKVRRLAKTLHERLGHRLAFAAEAAKIALSESEDCPIPLDFLEPGLAAAATQAGLGRAIGRGVERIHRAAAGCIAAAGLKPAAIETIFFTGGSSRVPAVRRAVRRAAPAARPAAGSDLLSVALGLTQEARRRFG
jgi:hypothetical chaperone protein